ncbi:Parkinson disease protein 7 homolog [Paramacrobiotus metropolitanus]|uniref:Parkinson disease protein 7 homolog n=1 Tax=Paramacrobiotus metropolitanus TaxID=2943436 RepID=UPI00244587A8|nr:Parkinson disease protein 7 homolog [Paramacrobiotus metropolitanus]
MDKVIDAVSDALGTNTPAKTALIILSDGAEESEVVITADVLSRGGFKVTIAGFSGESAVKCSRGVQIKPEMSLDKAMDLAETKPYDVVVLPGGPQGTKNLTESVAVGNLLKRQEMNNGWIAAICGGPMALRSHSIGVGKCITAHKSKWDELKAGGQHKVCTARVCIDGHLITSQGPGTAFDFGLAIVEKLIGPENIPKLQEDLALKI